LRRVAMVCAARDFLSRKPRGARGGPLGSGGASAVDCRV
jgi:hypothetical protein